MTSENVQARGLLAATAAVLGFVLLGFSSPNYAEDRTIRPFKKLIYWNEVDKGGHFAANEQPQLFAEEMRAAFRSLRQQ